jgi:hypothetical protein
VFGGQWSLSEQGLGGEQHAWSAEAALRAALAREGFL